MLTCVCGWVWLGVITVWVHQIAVCGENVKPAQDNNWCRETCLDLNVYDHLATPGKCPTTCYDCAGWAEKVAPATMWLVIAISCTITPISLTIFRKWIEPINEDGSPMMNAAPSVNGQQDEPGAPPPGEPVPLEKSDTI